ncbi:TPA: type II/IV secretion system ATPase subunit [Candidatus Woesearchaeota archaeon]|nr:type II/IV secretion system ATPase subunit [Candidatus Woesearchaeota archaeon]
MTDQIRTFIGHREFDRLRLKAKLFTKEYDRQFKLLSIEPFFVDVRLSVLPENVMLVDQYSLKTGAVVQIYKKLSGTGYIYNMKIPEMNVSFNDLFDLYEDMARFRDEGVSTNAYIKRWYQNFGILEHLLSDEMILEININPPAYKTSMRIVHSKYQECTSNIYPSDDFLNYLATRLKISTGRPLNRAQPQLDGEIKVDNIRARVAAIIDPFSMFGTGYSIRKHREHPWTLPLFMRHKALNGWFSGLMSLVIAHGRSFLTAGPRGSGKTSLLGSLILEILPKYRIITIEDTAELPVLDYKRLGYDILPLKVRSALLKDGMEMPFDTGLRTSLRLGDSALIVGEVRSKEATVLYEAMRVGAMSNVVAGTIHADTPYGVYDRVVNDLGVPKGSFKVTDLIIIQNLIKTPSGLGRQRRVLSVTEVLKEWEDQPVFQELLVYNPQTDQLEPTAHLLEGRSVTIKMILKNTQGYKGYDDVLRDIALRGWAKDLLVKTAGEKEDLLEAPIVADANILFTKLMDQLEPLNSPENEDLFRDEYRKQLQAILREAIVQTDTRKAAEESEYVEDT